jgi:hypothetical protein
MVLNGKKRLLLVNDEPFLLVGYMNQFKNFFVVHEAENGYQAVQMVIARPKDYYDVIILDINMPIMNGFEACIRISRYLSNDISRENLNLAQFLELNSNTFQLKQKRSSSDNFN